MEEDLKAKEEKQHTSLLDQHDTLISKLVLLFDYLDEEFFHLF